MENDFDGVFAVMDEAFPDYEKRTREGQRGLLDNKQYRLLTKKDGHGRIFAFMAVWEFDSFCFVEHLAVCSEARGQGTGGKMMKEYLAACAKPVVLEVEPPQTDIAARRIAFYRRLGFQLNPYPYEQPPLRKGCGACPLIIMSSPRALNEREFLQVKNIIYREAYGVRRAGGGNARETAEA